MFCNGLLQNFLQGFFHKICQRFLQKLEQVFLHKDKSSGISLGILLKIPVGICSRIYLWIYPENFAAIPPEIFITIWNIQIVISPAILAGVYTQIRSDSQIFPLSIALRIYPQIPLNTSKELLQGIEIFQEFLSLDHYRSSSRISLCILTGNCLKMRRQFAPGILS